MNSYMKLFEDFLQRKECDGTRTAAAASEDEDIEHQITNLQPISGSVNAINNSGDANNKMEHSYTRDNTRTLGSFSTGLSPARTILVRRTPQCPSCHTHPLEEHDFDECNQADVPTYNEIAAKEAMNECSRIAKYVKNNNPDDDDWESRINQSGWSNMQKTLFSKVANILDNDQLGRLANANRQNEPMQRRSVVDKSASRMRKALAAVAWDSRLTQWLHFLLMDSLPSTYMASYLDILQTLKSKLPSLMDKMLFGRPLNVSQELLAPVMKNKWEPVANTKVRKLTQNAVIVALPSVPTSGPVPNRLQKWYHQLASITQIVQVTLPSNVSHIARQPLEQVAEQIASLTRVKIQELRNENPQRSIILIGFNAGSALALQVAMSENVACVVCMGFAYNTFNGVRGTPDDRILDIKIPILFVIGQNSAKTSTEEIESLREKMQSETSLVVVGSADDVLRVPKSRRKLDNVTQSLVDAMVVDELYEFIKKILTNPPGPRIPTTISSLVHAKQGRNATGNTIGSSNTEGNTKISGVQRKRKNEAMNSDQEQTPVKTKCVQPIGRPRTRPLNTTTSPPAKTSQSSLLGIGNTSKASQQQGQKSQISPSTAITNEDLNMAIQSILGDSNEPDGSIHNSSTESSQGAHKIVTNYEIVAPSKSTPIKTALLNPLQNKVIPPGAKIKMIPSNQFVQLKPPMQSQSKIYTIKTASMQQNNASGSTSIGSIVSTSPASGTAAHHQQQIFTLKSPNGQTTQFVTAAPPGTSNQKYTVVKNASGSTTLQLANTGLSNVKSTATTLISGTSTSNLDLSNIIDMPIVFADNDGNLSDSVGAPAATNKPANTSGVGQLIISQKIIKEANSSASSDAGVSSTVSTPPKTGGGTYIINKTAGSPLLQHTAQTSVNKQNKVVFINRNTMKPCPNIISRSNIAQQLPKYTKVVVTNPKTSATTLVPRPATQLSASTGSGSSGSTPIVSSVKQVNLQTLKSPVTIGARQTSGVLNVSTKSLPQVQIIGTTVGGAAISSTLANATNVATSAAVTGGSGMLTDRPQIRNIVVKPGGLKQIPAQLKSQLLNRNLTVRKLVNIVPATKTVGASSTSPGVTIVAQSGGMTSEASASGATSSGTSIQTSPKVITLNPINPSAPTGSTASGTNNSAAGSTPKNE
ncbi:PREDICTED: KAT8 regulatory NSL complex subunit 3 isoform X1 [Rhagoletis zephyria]|uniref:KAT8 regulatory NSL complex subunit 3 isoform X1 n=2 Tax=Rhagoletis zephyria TaxID=28612 RepID=UPI0008113ABC|nr:PREDICTED: KAT8 regulatory NSL complex subunit 3 isoform X1 [Rhagoletis zephyria]